MVKSLSLYSTYTVFEGCLNTAAQLDTIDVSAQLDTYTLTTFTVQGYPTTLEGLF